MTSIKRNLSGATYMVVAAILAMIGWAIIKGLLFFGHPLSAIIVMAAVAGGGIGASLIVHGRLDEVGRSTERFAWYWGGGGATALMLVWLPVYALAGAPFLDQALRGPWTPLDLIYLGALGLAAAQIMGFALIGVGWWLVRR